LLWRFKTRAHHLCTEPIYLGRVVLERGNAQPGPAGGGGAQRPAAAIAAGDEEGRGGGSGGGEEGGRHWRAEARGRGRGSF